jgi:hypothetical protein
MGSETAVRPAAAKRDDRILPVVRIAAVTVLAILGIAWWALYLHPAETETRFAWTITSEMTVLLMGSGYGSAVVFFLAVLFGRRWHRVTLGFLPTTVFTWMLAIATVLHWDRFHAGHPAFLLWAWVYALTPLVVPALWLINRRRDPGTPESRDVVMGGALRAVVAGVGGALGVLALVMFVVPTAVIEVWPWELTPLTARAVASFIALPAVAWLAMAVDRRWSAARIMVATIAVGLILLLISVGRAWSDFDQENWLTYLYVGGLVVTLVALVVMSSWLELAARRRSHGAGSQV